MNNSKETENFVPEEKFKKLMEILKAELNSQRILDRWTDPEGRNGCPSCTVHESREGDNVIRLDYQHHFGWQIEKFSRGKYDLETLGDNISLNKILEKYPELKTFHFM